MIIKSVRLKNIRSYLDEKIEFPMGSTLLSGDIGCGKSTILMAIDFAIFGLRKGELSGGDMLRHGASEGMVEVDMTIDNKDVRIKRVLKRGNSISHDICVLTINGLSQILTPTELKAQMLELLGYPQELLKKNKPIFRYTVYTPQEEMKKILSEDENRLGILRKIFNIDKYGTIRNNARLFLTELRSMKRELEAYSRDLEIKNAEKKELRENLAGISNQASEIRSRLSGIEKKYNEKKHGIDRIKSDIEELRKIQISMAKKESETGSLGQKIDDLEIELANIETKIQFNANLVLEMPEGSIEDASAAIRMLETDRDGMMQNIAVIDAEVDKLSAIFLKGVCSFCGQTVSEPMSFKNRIDESSKKRQEILEGIRQAEERLDALKSQKSAIERFNAVKRIVDDLKRWKADKQAESARTKTLLEAAESKLAQLQRQAEKYSGLESSFRTAETELAGIEREKLELEKSSSRLEQQAEDIRKRLSLLDIEIKEKEAARKKSGEISSLTSWFDNFILLMENIEKHVLLTVQKEFDQYFQYWFSIIMGDTLSVRIDDQFAPVIEQNGYETSFTNLSGGEKTSVSLAYRLALNKVINIMIDSIRTKDLLILDEPTDGFSTDQLDRVRDVINALGLKQVIIVSHEPKIDTYVENVIKVYKEDHISRVATQ